ncbi:MAG: glycosyltransferase family 4 protein [Gammaproteobacteria bacterium]|nr:glycosyltransferase family 4 protein [Gammaproteobacteria bacterium]
MKRTDLPDPLVLFVVNDPAFFVSHRLPVARAAVDAGYDVHVATPSGPAVEKIRAAGLQHHVLPLSRSGKHPFSEIRTLLRLYRLFRSLRPGIVHLVTIKPVLYGGLMARLCGIDGVVAAISGLGYAFSASGRQARLFRRLVLAPLYRLALGHPNLRIIFQNADDREVLTAMGAVREEQAVIIRGSGADLDHYVPAPEPAGPPLVVMAGRLLRDKGIAEFVNAARLLQERGVEGRFALVGRPDPGNPASISEQTLRRWQREGAAEWWGFCPDMARVFAQASLVVLPSYYGEGLPKVLIEAAACGRAVVTTDWPGCRDAIEPDVTGLLVPPRDTAALADATAALLNDPARRHAMGQAGRRLAERAFDIRKVVADHLAIYAGLLPGTGRPDTVSRL